MMKSSVRSTFFFQILISLASMACFRESHSFERILTIPWGQESGEVRYRRHPAGNFGPTDFTIEKGGSESSGEPLLYLLDAENSDLVIFSIDDSVEIARYPIPRHCRRLTVRESEIVLWDGVSLFWIDTVTRRNLTTSRTLPFRAIDRMLRYKDELMLVDEEGRSFAIEKSGECLRLSQSPVPSNLPRIEKLQSGSFLLKTLKYGSIRVEYPHEIGSIEYIGSTDSVLCLAIETVISPAPIFAKEYLLFITGKGKIIHEIELPLVYFTDFPRRVKSYDSRIFLFLSAPGGLSLYAADIDELVVERKRFPPISAQPYHYNWYLPFDPAETGITGRYPTDPITRDSVMCMAQQYIDLKWIATDENITDGIERMPDGTYVRTPAWVRPGELMKVPYKWGGFTSTDDFAAGVLEGKKCGDDYLESMGHSDEYCIGVDCSGFVSRCWGTEEKYLTATMDEISHELPSYQSLLRGDAINKPHHHIRLVAEDSPSGMILTMEAGADWRVSYHLCKLTSLTGYIPIRFDQIMESITRDPFVIAVKPGDHEVRVRRGPSSDEDVITSVRAPARYVSTAYHNGWYHFHIPSGTGIYGGWCFGGEESGFGDVEGDQDVAMLNIVGNSLNAYSGPGSGFPYVTTVSPGQRFSIFAEEAGWYGIFIANVPDHMTGWVFGGSNLEHVEVIAGGPHDGFGAEILDFDYPSIMNEREQTTCTLRLINTGSCSWNGETRIRTTVPRERSSLFSSISWIDSSTITGMRHAVLPHQAITIIFDIEAPHVGFDSLFSESFGIMQADFGWFGDTGQIGPGDSAIIMDILVRDIGLPEAPSIDISSVEISDGIFRFSWEPVSAVSHYGVFRGLFGSESDPERICITDNVDFADSAGIHKPTRDVYYHVKAYCPCDSSGFSISVGEFEFAGGNNRSRTSCAH